MKMIFALCAWSPLEIPNPKKSGSDVYIASSGPTKTAPLGNPHTSVTTVTLITLIRWITHRYTH